MKSAPRSGRHNPLKNPERYVKLGQITARAAEEMRKPEVTTTITKKTTRFLNRVILNALGINKKVT